LKRGCSRCMTPTQQWADFFPFSVTSKVWKRCNKKMGHLPPLPQICYRKILKIYFYCTSGFFFLVNRTKNIVVDEFIGPPSQWLFYLETNVPCKHTPDRFLICTATVNVSTTISKYAFLLDQSAFITSTLATLTIRPSYLTPHEAESFLRS
jgi:hypothetical protein